MENKLKAFERLLNIMDDLREKCPWDRKQTIESLRILTIEEMYELADAIIDKDMDGIKEEIGDVLLHMVFYAKIGSESGHFDIADALNSVCDKLIHRHPHIYGDVKVENEEDVKRNWEQLKLAEGKGKKKKTLLSGVPNSLPAMVKAYRMQQKTKQVGFEWETTEQVKAKLDEEMAELEEAISNQESFDRVEEEFGDVLFSMVNYARFLKVDPEAALEKINKKFKSRFGYIEAQAKKPLEEMTLEEMDQLWNEAKHVQKQE
jgi:XTP/dITP diphosphohydrolase